MEHLKVLMNEDDEDEEQLAALSQSETLKHHRAKTGFDVTKELQSLPTGEF